MTVHLASARLSPAFGVKAVVGRRQFVSTQLFTFFYLEASFSQRHSVTAQLGITSTLTAPAGIPRIGAFLTIESTLFADVHRYVAPIPSVTPVMTDVRRKLEEIEDIIERMSNVLMAFASSKGLQAAEMRAVVGDLRAHSGVYAVDGTLPTHLLQAFKSALTAGITLNALDSVLAQLRSEDPTDGVPLITVQVAIGIALAMQSRIISTMVFRSRDDVDAVQARMKLSFDLAKELAADTMSSDPYNRLVDLAAMLSRHLADNALTLPKLVQYELQPMTALHFAHRIYADGSRWDELVTDNKIVHPAFCPAAMRALSS